MVYRYLIASIELTFVKQLRKNNEVLADGYGIYSCRRD